ncbi:MAG: hypothetical protein AB8B56_03420 [Crocinitomicaceae bacterium]
MKLKITILGAFALAAGMIALQACVENDETGEISLTVQPQDLPGSFSGDTDFKFPEKESVITGWLGSQDSEKITKHAWGIWQGLTSKSDQVYNDQALLVYQTWLGASDLAKACANGDTDAGCNVHKTNVEMLDHPNQHHHAFGGSAGENADIDPSLYVTVSYSPGAACYATSNLIFNQSIITSKMNGSGGIGTIDPFPNNGVTIKPTYYIGKKSDKYIRIPAWKGPPLDSAQSYGPKKWKSYVYADVSNSQTAGKIAVPTTQASGNPPANAIVNLNEFIQYSLDQAAADYMNEEQGTGQLTLEEGDLAVLVAMHVATKEMSNWTWQTFFWTTNPSSPDFPSSSAEAALMPSDLTGAASHYAVSSSYAMVWPNQPVTGGTNEGVTAHVGYNPYLEAGLSGPFGNENKLNSAYQYGMQSNCMSCHAQAATNDTAGFFGYTADQYIDMSDTMFNGWVQLDFAWSIQGNINKNK